MMEAVILKNLATNETYARKVHPFLKEEYFSGNANKKIFGLISDFITKYNSLPTREAVDISLSKLDLVFEVDGLEDDSSGTITGTANKLLESPQQFGFHSSTLQGIIICILF